MFAYDADGRRVHDHHPMGRLSRFFPTTVTEPPAAGPIPYAPPTGWGQIVPVQTKVGTATGTFYYTYTDHLGIPSRPSARSVEPT